MELSMRAFVAYFALSLACGSPFSTAAIAAASHAASSGARGDTTRLLNFSEKNTPPAVAAVRTEYAQLAKAYPADARIDYVYAIALINQHRYEDAVSHLDRYLASHANDPHALRARIWAELHNRGDASALRDAVRLSQGFHQNPPASPAPELQETAHFLGVVFGYLDLRGQNIVSSELQTQSKSRVLAALGDAYLPAFDKGRQSVADRLTELEYRRQLKQQQVAEKTAQRQELVEAALEEDRATVATSQEAIQASAEQLGDAQRQLGVLSTQLTSLGNDRIRLTTQIAYVQALLLDLQADLTKDSKPSNGTTPSFSIEAQQYASLNLTLSGLTRQTLELDDRVRSLRMQAAQLNVKGRREAQTLAASQAVAKQAGRRAKALEAQSRRLESEQPQRRVLTAEMKRFSTYLPFPFEEEKQRVLEWFEN